MRIIYICLIISIVLLSILLPIFLIKNDNKNVNKNYNNPYKQTGQFDIIITASYIPSHPSIDLIRKTIESLHYINYTGDNKIDVFLSHDFSSNTNYMKYFENLKKYCENYKSSLFNLIIIKRETHGHLVGNVRNALKHVNNEYLLIIQHDFPFCNHFNINTILQDMKKYPELKHIRFNKRKNEPVGWDNDKINFWNNYNVKGNNNYISTVCWSDNNHLTRKSYYNNIVMKKSKDGNTMEHFMNTNRSIEDYHDTYIYGELGEKKYINHLDGRKHM